MVPVSPHPLVHPDKMGVGSQGSGTLIVISYRLPSAIIPTGKYPSSITINLWFIRDYLYPCLFATMSGLELAGVPSSAC